MTSMQIDSSVRDELAKVAGEDLGGVSLGEAVRQLVLTARDRGLRHHVRIASEVSGLGQPSWARTEEITSVSTHRFGPSPTGRAASGEIAELRRWLPVMVAF